MQVYPYAISSRTVLPTHVAPALNRAVIAGAVDVAAECVRAQSGFPKPVTYPSTSNLISKFQFTVIRNTFPAKNSSHYPKVDYIFSINQKGNMNPNFGK